MTQWTEDQKKVIGSTAGRLLCSAAAGSGKTAVMIERVVRMIREGADPFSFLVITFTNAAAAEMKEKIRKRLADERENPAVAAAAEKAGAMEVCTIHAFCQHLIRQEFQAVSVDPAFGICSPAQRVKLFQSAFRKACAELKKQEDTDYRTFSARYEPAKALEIVTTTYEFIRSLPDPLGWLSQAAENVPLRYDRNHPWYRTTAKLLREKVLAMQVLLRRQAEMFDEYEKSEAYRKVWLEDHSLADALRRWVENGEVTREEVERGFVKLPPLRNLNDREIDWKDRYRDLRDQLKETVEDIQSFILQDQDRTDREFAVVQESVFGLKKLAETTHRYFELNKSRAGVLDFADLEHKALAILRDEEVCRSVQRRYRHIFVDECQDISSIQDALIHALAGEDNTLFMVGDVKQSIYRFRQANPKLFRDRLEGTKQPDGEVCYLQENFRSRPEILDTVNLVFRDVMRRETADMDYTPREELNPGRTGCAGYEPVRVDLLETGGGKDRLTAVADHVAEEIREMIRSEKYGYRDMVILMPEVSTDGPEMTRLLKERKIPVLFDGDGDYFSQPEIVLFRNLLELLANPHLDLPLLSVLVHPPFCFSEEELSLIRLEDRGKDVPFWKAFEKAAEKKTPLGEKCRKTAAAFEDWRFQAAHKPLGEMLWFLMEDSRMYALAGCNERGRTAQRNLRSLCMQADRAQEQGVSGLREFLAQLAEQASAGETQAAPSLAEEDQMVRLMTMHKSKGLQFPVVFCLGLDRGLTGKHPGPVTLDEELGVCLPYKVPRWRLSRKTAADRIFEWKREHDVRAERTCLLYVAMTRAQDRLYLVGTETDRLLWHLPAGEHRVLAAEDYLDWIMPALTDDKKKSTTFTQAMKPWKITIFERNQQENVDIPEDIHNLRYWVETIISAPPVDDLWKTGTAPAGPETDEGDLKKYSVSALLQEARNRIFLDPEQTLAEKRTPDYVRRMMRRFSGKQRPAVPETPAAADGAARGTVIHHFLSLVDLDRVRGAGENTAEVLEAMRKEMTEQGIFTEEEASWIRMDSVGRFFASGLGRRLLASPEVRREWDFNLCLRDREMIVQGMIDCAFREGDGWILLDYKTDTIRDEEAFVEEYRPQLAWYAKALRDLTGMPVRESWLYALSVDKAFALGGQEQA